MVMGEEEEWWQLIVDVCQGNNNEVDILWKKKKKKEEIFVCVPVTDWLSVHAQSIYIMYMCVF